jgi:hypothetical protein
MKTFKVQKINCDGAMYPFMCSLCRINFTQRDWYYIVAHGWFHSEECTQMYILREMGNND